MLECKHEVWVGWEGHRKVSGYVTGHDCEAIGRDRAMSIRFRCPCGKTLKAPGKSAGRRARCPNCSRLLRVPEHSVPAEEEEQQPARSEKGAKQSDTELEQPPKARILLADEADGERAMAREILENHGYYVIEVDDGERAVDLVRKLSPDLIVADVRLPRLSGFQVVQALKDPMNPQNSNCWQTPFILTTRKVRGRDKQYAISLGVGAYLQKPLTPAELCSRIDRLLAGNRLGAS